MSDESSKFMVVDDAEMIARIIFSPSMVSEGNIAPSAFFLVRLKNGNPEKELSVWRLKLRVPNRNNAVKARIKGDELYGYAKLCVGDCHKTVVDEYRCKVKVNLNSPNQYHAGIYYTRGNEPVIGECYDPVFMMFTSCLASQSTLVVL